MAHRRAKLTPFGRLLLVQRVRDMNWSVPRAAESAGVSRITVYKWLHRFDELGLAGLEDGTSRPLRSPRITGPDVTAAILDLRRRLRWGPHQIALMLDMAPSTVHAVLLRAGESRLSDADRATGVRIRYVKDHPGELIHVDVKKLGRIPDGGGHAILGNPARVRRGGGWDYYHVAVDDYSRVAFGQLLDHDDGPTAAEFLLDVATYFKSLGVHIQRVMTDRAFAYMQSKRFKATLDEIGAKHRPTKPFRPQTNGKAEAFIKTSLREWAYAQLYTSNQSRRDALPNWLHYYVHYRNHTELGMTPMEALVNNVPGKYN